MSYRGHGPGCQCCHSRERVIMYANRTPAISRFLLWPFSFGIGLVDGLLGVLLPRRAFFRKRLTLFSMIFSLAKFIAIALLVCLAFEPRIFTELSPDLRNIIGCIAILGGVLGLLGTVSGVFHVALISGFWFVATIYLGKAVFSPGNANQNYQARSNLPISLPGGLDYYDIPQYQGKPINQEVAFGDVPSHSSFPISLSNINPVPLIGKFYQDVGNDVSSLGSSVSGSVSQQVSDVMGSLNINPGGTGASVSDSIGIGSGSALPDSAFFPKSLKGRTFYPMRGAKQDGTLTKFMKDIGIE